MKSNGKNKYDGGFDAGIIVDGVVKQVGDSYIIVDDDGVVFNPAEAMNRMLGQRVRMTMASFETLENMSKMLLESGNTTPS